MTTEPRIEWRLLTDERPPAGRIVILFAITSTEPPNWMMATGYWHHDFASRGESYTEWSWDGRWLRIYDHQPTHWMPLPEPPASEAIADLLEREGEA